MKKESNKGITLIALIITIIVLLILAGITIAMVVGDNGIIAKAGTAKDKTNESQAAEENRLADYENKIDTLGRAGNDNFIKILYRHVDGNTGYTIYSDGFVDQWGYNACADNVVLPIAMRDTNYNITGVETGNRNNYNYAEWGGININKNSATSISVSWMSQSNHAAPMYWKVSGFADVTAVNNILAAANINYTVE